MKKVSILSLIIGAFFIMIPIALLSWSANQDDQRTVIDKTENAKKARKAKTDKKKKLQKEAFELGLPVEGLTALQLEVSIEEHLKIQEDDKGEK